MKSFPLTWLIGFLVTWFASGLIAGLVVTPLFKEAFGAAMRAADNMDGMAPMTLGFVLMSLVLTLIYARLPQPPGIPRGLMAGLLVAGLIVSDYLIVVGWSSLPATATIGSGILTALGPILGGLAIGLFNRNAPEGN